MKSAYYAHCMALYNTPQESRDLALIQSLGFATVNPNSVAVERALRRIPKAERMDWFKRFADTCDVIFFRALPDGYIPSGVAKEIQWFMEQGKPVIELPSCISRRVMSLEQTREYLAEVGQR